MEEEKEKTIFLIDLEKAEYPYTIFYSQYNLHKIAESRELEEKGFKVKFVKLSPEEFFKTEEEKETKKLEKVV